MSASMYVLPPFSLILEQCCYDSVTCMSDSRNCHTELQVTDQDQRIGVRHDDDLEDAMTD